MKPLKTQAFTKKNLHGFTLVELIVVITILVILGTIAFTSLTGFSGNARDSDRVTTLKNIESGLDLHQIKSGTYPTPENIIGTGVINNTVLSSVGIIGDTISRIIKINKIPTDPLSKTNYVYGVNSSQSQYQIATTLENPVAYNISPLVQTAYADFSLQARVNGNYSGYIKYMSGTETWIANIPSLLFSNTGSTNLLSTGTYFVVNKQQNLPYKIDDKTQIQNKNPDDIIKTITNTPTATLTGARIDNITKETLANTFTGTLLASFGWDIAKIETVVLGTSATVAPQTPNSCTAEPTYTDATFTIGTPTQSNQEWQWLSNTWACYYTCGAWRVLDNNACVSETCAGTTPDGTAKISNATSFAWGTWNYNPAWAKCSYTCGTWYHTEDSWVTCISDMRSCSITNWVWSQAWTTSWWACTVVSCNANYTVSGTTACTDQTAPTGWDFTLPATTNSTSVTLSITCPTDAVGSTPIQMYISWAWLSSWWWVWESCVTGKNITVTSWDGSKAITMKWKDSMGNESGVVSKSVSLSIPRWEQLYTTPWTYTWTVPAGVTSVSVVCIGGGGWGGIAGGGGGWLAYKNNHTVAQGISIAVIVGIWGTGTTGNNEFGNSGGNSSFSGASIVATGGGGGISGGFSGPGVSWYSWGLGAGWSGCNGPGANAGNNTNGLNAGCSAGGTAWGIGSTNGGIGGPGGGAWGSNTSPWYGWWGGGGSGLGKTGTSSNGGTASTNGGIGGGYGWWGGGAWADAYHWGGVGGNGACRIIWPGNTRTFPSTDVGP